MVAEFVGRGQSGSPIDGELPHLNSNMPGSQSVLSPGSPGDESYPPGYNLANHLKHKDLFSQRKQREFIPDNKKDESYWDRRRRNNEAAKRSREKRRFNDMVLEQRVVELTKENYLLKAQLDAIKEEYGICGENLVCVDKVLASLPSNDQVLSMTKRQKVSNPQQMIFSPSPSPIPTSVIHQPVMGSPPPTQMHPHAHLHPPPSSNDHPYPESNEFYPYSSFHSNTHFDSGNSVLNLSRSRSRVQSPFEVSSNSGDESVPVPLVVGECNNSLPLKLRHKSHLGEKDAASTLLSLQHIKQEPAPTVSPRSWDGENSSDDRDSGISIPSIGHQEWSATAAAAATLQTLQKSHMAMRDQGDSEAKNRLHSEIVRLSSEVEHLKSIMCRGKGTKRTSPSQ